MPPTGGSRNAGRPHALNERHKKPVRLQGVLGSPVAEGRYSDLLPLESHDLSRQRPSVKVALSQLPVEIGTPRVDGSSLIDCSRKARLLLANSNV